MMKSNIPAFEKKREIRQKMLAKRRALSATDDLRSSYLSKGETDYGVPFYEGGS